MSFHSKSFGERLNTMGDLAEEAFEVYARDNGIPYIRTGFNRPPFSKRGFQGIPKFFRMLPDFMTEIDETVYYIECKGFSRSPLKVKMDTLNQWYAIQLKGMRTLVFIYNSDSNQHWILDSRVLMDNSQEKPVLRFSNDKNEYVEFTKKEIIDLAGEYGI